MPTIYLTSANPFVAKPLRFDLEQRAIFRRLPKSWDIKPAPAARLSDIISDLRKYNPEIVHFSAHGSPTERIVLLNDKNEAEEVSRAIIESLFSVMKENIRLVILNACYLRTQAEQIAETIECVIGVRKTLADDDAIKYVEQFYEALAARRSIKKAHEEASIILTDVSAEHKPDLIVKVGVDADKVLIDSRPRPKTHARKPPQQARLSVSSDSAARKAAFERSVALYGVSADRFSVLKIGNPDGSYVLRCEIEGLRSENKDIEAMTWRFASDGGLVMAPIPDEAAINDGISWVTEPDPPISSYDDVVKNLATLGGKFVLDPSLKRIPRSFAWTMQVLNGDAVTAWEFHNLYSKEQQVYVSGKPRTGKPSEYFAHLVWFPIRTIELGVRLPPSHTAPPQLRYFELKKDNANDAVPITQVVPNGELRTGPDYNSDWGRLNAKWARNTEIERLEKGASVTGADAELKIQYPILGSYYSLDWPLPDPELPPEIEKLSAETAVVRGALLANRTARFPGPPTDRSEQIRNLFMSLHQAVRNLVQANEPSFGTSLMTWDYEKRRMVVVEVCRNDGRENEREWDFWVPFGLGLSGMCFRSANRAFRYKRDLDHGSPDRPENYLPVPGTEPHAFLLSLPIDHPEMTVQAAQHADFQRCRQLVAVLSIGSRSAASSLREYCRDTLGDEEFRRLRNLRDTCQVKFDAISRLLLESEGIRKGRDPSKADGPFPSAEPDCGAPDAGIIHQPNAAWISPTGRNRFRHKVVAFDFDGTLLRGQKFVFSWELVWKSLGFGKAIQNELKREYRQEAGKSASRTDRIKAYSRWCERAVEKFKSRGLTRDQIRVMSKSLSLTKNCREALSLLRAEGMVTAIISGGISTLLEDSFPDFREYFDFVFMNELIFSQSGIVCGVNATAYDFEGKAEALALVRVRAGTAPDATAFVGDHFNDEAVMLEVPTAIAYLPNDAVAESVSHHTVNDDDLLAILPYLLVE